jgi:hypothetical protein
LQLTRIDLLFWALALAGHCILLAVLLVRRRARSFPIFTLWIASDIFRSAVLFAVQRMGTTDPHFGSSRPYFYTYWTLAVADAAFQLGVAYELASHVFKPIGAWAPDVRRSFSVLLSVSLALAAGLTWLASPPTHTLRRAVVIRGDLFASALVSELFVAMIALSVTLGLPWRTHVARLAQGLGIFSILGIVLDAQRSYLGSRLSVAAAQVENHAQMSCYLVCVAFWTVMLYQNEPAPRRLPQQLHAELRVLQQRTSMMLHQLRTMGSES